MYRLVWPPNSQDTEKFIMRIPSAVHLLPRWLSSSWSWHLSTNTNPFFIFQLTFQTHCVNGITASILLFEIGFLIQHSSLWNPSKILQGSKSLFLVVVEWYSMKSESYSFHFIVLQNWFYILVCLTLYINFRITLSVYKTWLECFIKLL